MCGQIWGIFFFTVIIGTITIISITISVIATDVLGDRFGNFATYVLCSPGSAFENRDTPADIPLADSIGWIARLAITRVLPGEQALCEELSGAE